MTSEDTLIRTFLAVELKPDVQKSIAEKSANLKTGVQFAGSFPSWVDQDNLHVTLFFLGKIKQDQIDHIQTIMNNLQKPDAFEINLKNLGVFPNAKNPSVLWLGIEEGKKNLVLLHKMIVEKLIPLGFVTEGRPFHPHITLARIKSRKNIKPLMDVVHSHRSMSLGTMEVEKFVLMKSILKPDGPEYSVLHEFKLQV